MTVTVLLFARARDLTGRDQVLIDLPFGAKAGELRSHLAQLFPGLRSILHRCALAVNEEFIHDDGELPADSTVAVLPPVSGG